MELLYPVFYHIEHIGIDPANFPFLGFYVFYVAYGIFSPSIPIILSAGQKKPQSRDCGVGRSGIYLGIMLF